MITSTYSRRLGWKKLSAIALLALIFRSANRGRLAARGTLRQVLRVTARWGIISIMVATLVGCASLAGTIGPFGAATSTPTEPLITKQQYLNQICRALQAYEVRHRQWHVVHANLNDHHWDASFVPIVQDPLLKAFENPPAADRPQVAAIRQVLENASAKFSEATRHWTAGDKAAAEGAEGEAF